MKRPPRRPDEPLFNAFVTFRVFFVSILMTAGTLLLFSREYSNALNEGIEASIALSRSQTIAVTFVIVFQVFYMIICRSLKDSVFKIGFFSNKKVFVGIAIIVVLHSLFIYTPFMQKVFGTTALDLRDLMVAIGVGFLIFPIIGLEKLIVRKLNK